jgi:anti-sigma B factor antagonist/stage II sporulation protein AA (anti-sigma F factor antagonist)
VELASWQWADVVVAAPAGRIDHTNAEKLNRALAPLLDRCGVDTGALLLDLANVDYISSIGLRVLMVAAKQARFQEARIAVTGLQPVVDEIFQISRFNYVLDVFPTVRAALENLSPSALAAYDAAAGNAAR